MNIKFKSRWFYEKPNSSLYVCNGFDPLDPIGICSAGIKEVFNIPDTVSRLRFVLRSDPTCLSTRVKVRRVPDSDDSVYFDLLVPVGMWEPWEYELEDFLSARELSVLGKFTRRRRFCNLYLECEYETN